MGALTIKDIAKICGVSVTTVSRALNNYPGINQDTKERIMEVVREKQFIPNNSARNLKKLENHSIAVLVKGIGNPFFQPMMGTLEKIVHKRKYTFILQGVNENEDEIEVASELVLEKKPKGIVFLGGYFKHTEAKLKQLGLPCVICTVGGSIDEKSSSICSCVHVDDIKESYRIVDYLCKSGHKRIATFVATRGDKSISAQRLEGYRKALSDNGLPVCDELIRYTETGENAYTMERGYQDMKELLKENIDFTAIYAISDAIAIGICRALKEEGKKVPEDYSVVGFDGLEMASYYIPTITTVKQPVQEMAKAAAEILFDEIENNCGVQHRIFEGEILIRESSCAVSK
ncbi:MAG: LacI family DNA-binding transcriptional regulator [Eubacteriales bacterium]|nr:LacI family DNA-binding transcriptional regulator [Eubacteriales bacterium]